MSYRTVNALPPHYKTQLVNLVQGKIAVSYLLLRCGITPLDEVSEVSRHSLGLIFNFCDAFSRFLVCHQKLNIKD